ncbi:hypothetical protein ACFL2M_02525, partial [Patescibacteria group bacterium]
MKKETSKYITSLLDLHGENVDTFEQYIFALEDATGRKDLLDNWVKDADQIWDNVLEHIGVKPDAPSETIITALEKEMDYLNMELLHFFKFPDFSTEEGWNHVMGIIMDALPKTNSNGFFLKHDVAKELIRKHPPQEIIDHFGYKDVDELLEKEDIREVYSALRFAVTGEWNEKFLARYESLTPDDFEKRGIEFVIMSADKWFALAEDFAKAKLHPFSHLKEMGIIFVVIDPKGVKDRDVMKVLITLVLHYLFEVDFYAKYFHGLAKRHKLKFGKIIREIIMGDIIAKVVPEGGVRITHKYYTKKPNPDERVYEPHVIPEPIHWHKGRRLLRDILCKDLGDERCVIDLWDTCYNVGRHVNGKLVSFNFADNIVANSEHKTYHLYEDIWNSIFAAFFSEKELERCLLNHLEDGYIDI